MINGFLLRFTYLTVGCVTITFDLKRSSEKLLVEAASNETGIVLIIGPAELVVNAEKFE